MRFSQEHTEHIFFEQLDSTNDYLQKINGEKNLSEGTVVWTNFQTHGKGHEKNTWESDEGKNLLMSILLKPTAFDATDQFQISRVISLALVDLVKKYCKPVSIKWPNDILVGRKKIAGILIENTIMENKISDSIAGIGLNINQSVFPVYIPDPTSLKLETGCHFDILNFLNDLIHHIENRYTQLLNMETQELEKAYEDILFGFEEVLDFEENYRPFSAKIVGISPGGQLKLEMQGGGIRKFGFKEVIYKL